MNFLTQLVISNMPEMSDRKSELYLNLLDVHHDLLNIADYIGRLTGIPDIPPDNGGPDSWATWPMRYLHLANYTFGEDIEAGMGLSLGSDGKVYRYDYLSQGLEGMFAVANVTAATDQVGEITLYGTVTLPYLVEPDPAGAGFSPVYYRVWCNRAIPDPLVLAPPGIFSLGYEAQAGSGAYVSGAMYVGSKTILFTGSKYQD